MVRVPPSSLRARRALRLVEALQQHFAAALAALDQPFTEVTWLRDDGRHGGGTRREAMRTPFFDRASVNVSCVHYDDLPARPLAAATALSTIIHPAHPLAPSLHLHVSCTELRAGRAAWRLMADLNPSHPMPVNTARFTHALEEVLGPRAAHARAEGDRYFFIPALGRHRGAAHFYEEDLSSGDFEADVALAQRFAQAAIDTYVQLLHDAPDDPPEEALLATQRAYHTLYTFQVLTLDRGTTSGLLVHDQNDVGILGSLPSQLDRALFASWVPRVPPPQDALMRALLDAAPDVPVVEVTPALRATWARVVRAHYRHHPEALELQARGERVPPTVHHHLSPP